MATASVIGGAKPGVDGLGHRLDWLALTCLSHCVRTSLTGEVMVERAERPGSRECISRDSRFKLPSDAAFLLFDRDCGFCRWTVAWLLTHQTRCTFVPVPIRSPLGDALLRKLSLTDRMRSAHIVRDGRLLSGGAALADVVTVLARGRVLERLVAKSPGLCEAAYRLVATNRRPAGRLVPLRARTRADCILERTCVETPEQLAVQVYPAYCSG